MEDLYKARDRTTARASDLLRDREAKGSTACQRGLKVSDNNVGQWTARSAIVKANRIRTGILGQTPNGTANRIRAVILRQAPSDQTDTSLPLEPGLDGRFQCYGSIPDSIIPVYV